MKKALIIIIIILILILIPLVFNVPEDFKYDECIKEISKVEDLTNLTWEKYNEAKKICDKKRGEYTNDKAANVFNRIFSRRILFKIAKAIL